MTFSRWAGLGALAVLAAAPVHAETFLTAIADIPLMEGMTEAPNPVVFESDKGRIIRTSARALAITDGKRVDDFYARTLPALGWTLDKTRPPAADKIYHRGEEQLTLTILTIAGGDNSGTIASFELVVKLASSKLPE